MNSNLGARKSHLVEYLSFNFLDLMVKIEISYANAQILYENNFGFFLDLTKPGFTKGLSTFLSPKDKHFLDLNLFLLII
jgi:hypothetical protein